MNSKLTAERLCRQAIVYVRQSSPGQVLHNQESQRRQYGLVDHARELGFAQVSVIDDDLGRSGSGLMDLVLGNGRRIEFASVDRTLLADLIGILERA